MKNNDITAIWLWKHPAEETDSSVRLAATVTTPGLMTTADLIARDNVEELIEQDDRIVAVDIFLCDDISSAERLRDTAVEIYRIRGLDETCDIWPDVSVGMAEGGEGILLLQSFDDGNHRDNKIKLHDRRTPDVAFDLDKRQIEGSWYLSRTDIAEADCREPQYQAALRAARRIAGQVKTYDSRMNGIVAQEVQREVEKVYGAIVGIMDTKTEDFEDDLIRPESIDDARELQADLLQAADDISDDLHDAKVDAKTRLLDKMRENGSRFVASAMTASP